MRKLAFQLAIAAVLFIVATSVPAQERIIPSEAARYAGKKATVCGQVTSTNYAEDSKGRPTYLNLDRAYPNQKFNAVIPGENRDKFSKPPEIGVRYASGNSRFGS